MTRKLVTRVFNKKGSVLYHCALRGPLLLHLSPFLFSVTTGQILNLFIISFLVGQDNQSQKDTEAEKEVPSDNVEDEAKEGEEPLVESPVDAGKNDKFQSPSFQPEVFIYFYFDAKNV